MTAKMEPFTCHGHWWLPSDPNRKVAGILTYSPIEGISLDLKGAFSGSISLGQFLVISDHQRDCRAWEVSYVVRLRQVGSHLAGGPAATIASTFAIRFAVEGACFQKVEDTRCTNCCWPDP